MLSTDDLKASWEAKTLDAGKAAHWKAVTLANASKDNPPFIAEQVAASGPSLAASIAANAWERFPTAQLASL